MKQHIAISFLSFMLAAPAVRPGELAPSVKQPVSGVCVVSLDGVGAKREPCEMSTGNNTVPNGSLLVVEHVSASCATHPERGIFTLALIVSGSADGPARTVHVPVAVQSSTAGAIRLTGSHMMRLYAGAGTTVQVLASTWESAPPGQTACDVSFSGVLRPFARVN